ncbi:PAS domain-containing sensor histidine kinase [Rhodocista pekingensis]|uniref:histidine kinase n=1 Tax=Rhodocista pekingensis TaxID=201185 RepID=A0ABW2KXU1_9PROT
MESVPDLTVPFPVVPAQLVESLPAALFVFARHSARRHRFLYASPGWEELCGMPAASVPGRAQVSYELVHPEDRAALRAAIDGARPPGPWLHETRVRRGDGGWRWLRIRARPQIQPDGAVHWYGLVVDITAEKQARDRLAASEAQLRGYFQNAPEALFTVEVHEDGRFTFGDVNPTHERLTGLRQEMLAGLTPEEVLPPEVAREVLAHYRACVAGGEVMRYEESLPLPAGTRLWETVLVPIRDGSGRIARLLGGSTDITARRLHEEGLRTAAREAEEASRAKSEFLSGTSHELRTPLNAILGFTEALTAGIYGPLAPKQVEAVTVIRDAGAHLLELVNDLLDLARIEARRLPLDPEAVDAALVAREVTEMLALQAAQNGIALSCTAAAGLPPVWADPLRLRQIVTNLVGNAVKFTLRGGQVRLELEPAPGGGLLLRVSDTGIGIRAEDMDRLMQPFQALHDPAGRRPNEGLGLGLALTRALVEQHGGTMRLESRYRAGTTVTVTLPAAPAGALPARVPLAPPAAPAAA